MRQTNIELCRIAAIMLVVLVHSNYAWCGWPTNLASCRIPMLFVESLAIIGVNVFVLITGYFSANIKTKTFVNLFYICLFYGIVRLVFGAFTGHLNLTDALFISNSNWYIPTYIGLILLTPWLNAVRMTHKMGGVILALIFFEVYFGYFPAKSPVVPGSINWGYSIFSFSILYLIARYIRQYGVPQFFLKYCFTIYLLCTLIISFQGYALIYLCEGRGKDVVTALNHFVYSYNNPLVIISSVAFLISFLKMKVRQSMIINHIAQSVIAVLLIHTSKSINWFMKGYFQDIININNSILVFLLWVVGIFVIFIICVTLDQIRIISYKKFSHKLITYIEKQNLMFKI